jgi:hypothetical protein
MHMGDFSNIHLENYWLNIVKCRIGHKGFFIKMFK